MHALPEFNLRRPASLAQAAALLAAQPGARLVAGGTDLLPNLRRGLEQPPVLIDLSALHGLATVETTPEGMLLGAGLTIAELTRIRAVTGCLPTLAEAARSVAGPGHRSAATLGGNLCQDTRCVFYNQSEWWRASNHYCLKRGGDTCHVAPQGERCHAAFASDLAPVLLVLGAQVELLSAAGSRWMALRDLYRDDGAAHLTLARDEVLTRVRLPVASAGQRCGYRKARVRAAMDFPLAAVAVSCVLQEGCLAALAVGLSGTNSCPLLLDGTAELLGRPVDADLLARLGKLVQQQVSPMRSTATPANYRRQVATALAQRLLRELAGT
jgi:4-hydroxybenzoyl-CoA reductase subunit beta